MTTDLFPSVVETDRLRLVATSPASVDVHEAYRIAAHDEGIDEVARYVPWEPHDHPKETLEFLRREAEAHGAGESANYAIRVREDGGDGTGASVDEEARDVGGGDRAAGGDDEDDGDGGIGTDDPLLAGFCGLTVDWDRRRGELGIWLRERFWGRGYSGERALALLDLAFEVLDLEVVAIPVHVDNENSRRAVARYVDRVGGRRAGPFRHAAVHADGTVVDRVRFSVGRDDYLDADVEPGVSFRWDDAPGE